MPSPPIWRGNSTTLIEQPDSPQYTYGEKITQVRSFRGPFALCLSSAPWRGQLGTGAAAGYRVAETTIARERGGIGKLTIKYEINGDPGGAALPADEVSCDLEKFERSLREHPLFKTLSEALKTDISTLLSTAEDNSSHAPAKARVVANATANKLYEKEKKQFTHFLIYPPNIKVTRNYWSLPNNLSAGGYRETPPDLGFGVPTTLLGQPIEWIREGDRFQFNGTHYQVTSAWIGAIEWDHDIYP